MPSELIDTEKSEPANDVRPVGIFRGAAASSVAMLIRQGVAFLMAIVVARALGADGRGQLALIGQYAGVVALIAGLGFESGNAYFVGRRGKRVEQALADSLVLVAAATVIAAPALYYFSSTLVPALAGLPASALVLGSVSAPLILMLGLLNGVLVGQGRVPATALATALTSLVTVGVILVAWAAGSLSLVVTLAATVAGTATGVVVSLAATRAGRMVAPSWSRMRQEARYSLRSYVQNVAGYLELRQDVLLLGFLATSAAVGVYATGVAFAELLYFVPQTLTTALTAHVLHADEEQGAESTARVTRVLVAVSALSTLVLAVLIVPVTRIAFGPEFAQSPMVFMLLVPGVLSWAVGSQLQAYLAAHGQLFPVLGIVTLGLNLALNLALIPILGIAGAAISTSITYCAGNGYVALTFHRRTGLGPVETYLPRRDDMALLVHAVTRRMRSRRSGGEGRSF